MVLINKCLWLFAVMAILPIYAAAQSRDPKALDVLSHCVATSLLGRVPSDFVVTADLSDGTEMIFKGRSRTQYRVEVNSQSGKDYLISSKGRSWSKSGSGSVKSLPAHTSFQMPSPLFMFQLLDSLRNDATQVSDLGLDGSSGMSLQHIRLQLSSSVVNAHGSLALLASDWYVDPATSLVSRIEDHVASAQNANDTLPRIISLSKYHNFSGVMMPTVIEETLGGNHLFRFEVRSVAIDTGLHDEEFMPESTVGSTPTH